MTNIRPACRAQLVAGPEGNKPHQGLVVIKAKICALTEIAEIGARSSAG